MSVSSLCGETQARKGLLGSARCRRIEEEFPRWQMGCRGLHICDVETVPELGQHELAAVTGTPSISAPWNIPYPKGHALFPILQQVLNQRYKLGPASTISCDRPCAEVVLDGE